MAVDDINRVPQLEQKHLKRSKMEVFLVGLMYLTEQTASVIDFPRFQLLSSL